MDVVGTVAVALHLSRELYHLLSEAKHGPENVQVIAQDVFAQTTILTETQQLLQASGMKENTPPASLSMAVENCQEALQSLYHDLRPYMVTEENGKPSRLVFAKWPFKKSKIEEHRINLERAKSSLSLSLDLLNIRGTKTNFHAVREGQDFIISQIERLRVELNAKDSDRVDLASLLGEGAGSIVATDAGLPMRRFFETLPDADYTWSEVESFAGDDLMVERALTEIDSNPISPPSRTLTAFWVDPDVPLDPIFLAIYQEDTQAIQRLCRIPHLARSKYRSNGATPLHLAADMNSKEAAQILIEDGMADLHAHDRYGDSPLSYAVTAVSDEVAEVLLDHGANIIAVIESILSRVPRSGNLSQGMLTKMKFLQRLDEPPTVVSHFLRGNLDEKSLKKQLNYLLTAGFSLDSFDENGFAALHHAARNGQKEIVDLLLLNNVSPNTTTPKEPRIEPDPDGRGWGPVHMAAEVQDYDMLKLLLSRGADPNLVETRQYFSTPLTLAAQKVNEPMMRLLIEHRADVNQGDCSGASPIQCLGAYSPHFAQILLDAGADIHNAKCGPLSHPFEGRQVLHWAACCNNSGLINFLLDKGANIEATSAIGENVFHLASSMNRLNAARALLARLDDRSLGESLLTAKDEHGQTPMDSARGEIRELFRQYLDERVP